MSSDSETESDDANMGKIIPFEWQKGKGIALEFEENEDVFMQMLSAPDGVCGGETLMYYESPLDGKEYIYLATDEDEDVIGVLQYDVAREKWSKFCDYPAGFLPDLHGNCVDIATMTHDTFPNLSMCGLTGNHSQNDGQERCGGVHDRMSDEDDVYDEMYDAPK
eukprot:819002_1